MDLLNPSGASEKSVLRKLRHHGKRHHQKSSEERRGKFVISYPIEDRPASATNRSVRGHWEADTVVGKQGKACLVTLVDRKSRYLLGGKAASKTSIVVNNVDVRGTLGVAASFGHARWRKGSLETCSDQQGTEACDVLLFRSVAPMGARD